MPKIATTDDATVWECDSCEALAKTANAFTLPDGWWTAEIRRKTEGGRPKAGVVNACSKDCFLNAINYSNQSLVDYV